MGRVDDCYFPFTADVVPEELIWWSMPCLEGVGGHGEFRRNTLSGGTPQGLSSCTSPSSSANPFSVGPSWPRLCFQGWLCDVMSCMLLCLACPCVFVSVYLKEGLLLIGGMWGISGATVLGVFWHVIKNRCPRLDFLNEGFRPRTWQAANIAQPNLERKTCLEPSSKSILMYKSNSQLNWVRLLSVHNWQVPTCEYSTPTLWYLVLSKLKNWH